MGRFTSLSKETRALYLKESPVIILAQALLKDNTSGDVFAQVKFKNLSDKQICAMKVCVATWDVTGKTTLAVEKFQYLDLTVEPYENFGSQTLISLPDKSSREFKVAVLEVVFDDKAIWTAATNAVWELVPEQERLIDRVKSSELAEEYARTTCLQAQFVPRQYCDIWLCTCGNANKSQNEKCGACGQRYDDLIRALDIDTLEASCNDRKEQEAKLAEKEQEEAASRKKKRKKLAFIALAISALCIAVVLVMTKIVMPNKEYNQAVELYNTGEYDAALKLFEDLSDYKDSCLIVEDCKEKKLEVKYSEAADDMKVGKYSDAMSLLTEIISETGDYKDAVQMRYKAELNMCKVGDSFYFGEYEQNNNGLVKSPIEWIILEKSNDRVLMISKYALDIKPYNTTLVNVTWENCSLRKWLNETFLDNAFSQDEQDLIELTAIDSSQDKVFLLSRNEAKKYFKSDEDRKTKNTEYADGKCVDKYFTTWCFWWLRSQSCNSVTAPNADMVDGSGGLEQYLSTDPNTQTVNESDMAVRPAVWVDIN